MSFIWKTKKASASVCEKLPLLCRRIVLPRSFATRTAQVCGICKHSFHTQTRATNWLLNDANLDKLAQAEVEIIAAHYGLTASQPTQPTTANDETIWNFLKGKGLNDFAVAGIMGNLYAESALKSTNLQNVFEKTLGYTDETYTKAVDNGTYTNFVNDSAGYGLAQWTYWSRKENLYQYARLGCKSIGDLQMQLEFLWRELQGYTTVMKTLNSACSVLEASNIVLTQFEKPADQSAAVQTKRAEYGMMYYDKFAVKASVTPDIPAVSDWAREAWEWAKSTGFCDGTRSKDPATREEIITLFHRFLALK